ncbi:MAG TPA: 2Fe-2S iron-sulfur cluster-binding protein [Kaistia sp.]|nr:2Fe-2S iron-sulfur cluster-binding protein [Kaistia sp.]
MPRVTYLAPSGDAHSVDVRAGDSVMQGAIANGIDGIVAECGGSASCATCHVYVDEAFLPLVGEISPVEDEMLDFAASERQPNSRLGCQIAVTARLDGLVVTLPERQV